MQNTLLEITFKKFMLKINSEVLEWYGTMSVFGFFYPDLGVEPCSKKEKATLLESADFKLRAEAPATH